tara:strand:+ start:849 stop:956 length:108 start_codon:yes stop_codon:yes gene_type:complete
MAPKHDIQSLMTNLDLTLLTVAWKKLKIRPISSFS